MIKLISRAKFTGDVFETLTVSIDKKLYNYKVNSFIADRFIWMLQKKMGFKALNYLKKG